ncbi:MAG: TIGR02221 family CRISPR-associated protein [Acidobacteria bacterium]|nr:MAG: TIGR02221 family CRISPR-associated protein [Acidobacteriota bacterium]
MKALTFLGTGRYGTVTYVWDDGSQQREWQTNLFPEAVARIFQPQRMLVFVTPQAKTHEHFQALDQRLGGLLESVDIPEGRSEAELWTIFERVASSVQEGDTVLLDITHAFRSIPMIVFAVAAYLRRAKGVTIECIVYGAFEARNQDNRAPVFDLTPLLNLLEWLSGVEFFLQRSDGVLLAERLISIQDALRRKQPPSQTSKELPEKLKSVGDKLKHLSQALHLARPRDVMRYASELLPLLEKVAAEAERWAKPFALILEQVRSEVVKFAHNTPDQLDQENLQKQLALIEHLVDKGLWMQAVTLAREWVVSWLALQRGDGDWLDKEYREHQLESALGAAARELQKKRAVEKKQAEVPEWFGQLLKAMEIAELWSWLTQLRNDVAHCGMSRQAAGIQSIEQRARELPGRLKALADDVPDRVLYGGRVVIDLKSLYGEVAKLDELPSYLERAKELAGEGTEVVLTGQAPVWLYLSVAHALHGKARRLIYMSPVSGEVTIFDHNAL